MYNSIKLAFLLIFIGVEAQYSRKRIANPYSYPIQEIEMNSGNGNEHFPYTIRACVKRSGGNEDMGPFWANRGKRDPSYAQDPFYVDEPYWVLIRKDESFQDVDDPFFTSRGKKDVDDTEPYRKVNLKLRDRREFSQDVDSPFFAARGKKVKSKNDKF